MSTDVHFVRAIKSLRVDKKYMQIHKRDVQDSTWLRMYYAQLLMIVSCQSTVYILVPYTTEAND